MILTLHNVDRFDATVVQEEPGPGFGLLTRVGCTWLCVAVSDWKETNDGEDAGARAARASRRRKDHLKSNLP